MDGNNTRNHSDGESWRQTSSLDTSVNSDGKRTRDFENGDNYNTQTYKRQKKHGRKRWACEFCDTAIFFDYHEAVLHEKVCGEKAKSKKNSIQESTDDDEVEIISALPGKSYSEDRRNHLGNVEDTSVLTGRGAADPVVPTQQTAIAGIERFSSVAPSNGHHSTVNSGKSKTLSLMDQTNFLQKISNPNVASNPVAYAQESIQLGPHATYDDNLHNNNFPDSNFNGSTTHGASQRSDGGDSKISTTRALEKTGQNDPRDSADNEQKPWEVAGSKDWDNADLVFNEFSKRLSKISDSDREHTIDNKRRTIGENSNVFTVGMELMRVFVDPNKPLGVTAVDTKADCNPSTDAIDLTKDALSIGERRRAYVARQRDFLARNFWVVNDVRRDREGERVGVKSGYYIYKTGRCAVTIKSNIQQIIQQEKSIAKCNGSLLEMVLIVPPTLPGEENAQKTDTSFVVDQNASIDTVKLAVEKFISNSRSEGSPLKGLLQDQSILNLTCQIVVPYEESSSVPYHRWKHDSQVLSAIEVKQICQERVNEVFRTYLFLPPRQDCYQECGNFIYCCLIRDSSPITEDNYSDEDLLRPDFAARFTRDHVGRSKIRQAAPFSRRSASPTFSLNGVDGAQFQNGATLPESRAVVPRDEFTRKSSGPQPWMLTRRYIMNAIESWYSASEKGRSVRSWISNSGNGERYDALFKLHETPISKYLTKAKETFSKASPRAFQQLRKVSDTITPKTIWQLYLEEYGCTMGGPKQLLRLYKLSETMVQYLAFVHLCRTSPPHLISAATEVKPSLPTARVEGDREFFALLEKILVRSEGGLRSELVPLMPDDDMDELVIAIAQQLYMTRIGKLALREVTAATVREAMDDLEDESGFLSHLNGLCKVKTLASDAPESRNSSIVTGFSVSTDTSQDGRKLSTSKSKGARVYAEFSNKQYYWGTIRKVNKGKSDDVKTYQVDFEDGDSLDGIPEFNVYTEASFKRHFKSDPPKPPKGRRRLSSKEDIAKDGKEVLREEEAPAIANPHLLETQEAFEREPQLKPPGIASIVAPLPGQAAAVVTKPSILPIVPSICATGATADVVSAMSSAPKEKTSRELSTENAAQGLPSTLDATHNDESKEKNDEHNFDVTSLPLYQELSALHSKRCGFCRICRRSQCKRCYSCVKNKCRDPLIPPMACLRRICYKIDTNARRLTAVGFPPEWTFYFEKPKHLHGRAQMDTLNELKFVSPRGRTYGYQTVTVSKGVDQKCLRDFLGHIGIIFHESSNHFLVGKGYRHEWIDVDGVKKVIHGKIVSNSFDFAEGDHNEFFTVEFNDSCSIAESLSSYPCKILRRQDVASPAAYGGCLSLEWNMRKRSKQGLSKKMEKHHSVKCWCAPEMRTVEYVTGETGEQLPKMTLSFRGWKLVFTAKTSSIPNAGFGAFVTCTPLIEGDSSMGIDLRPGELLDIGVYAPFLVEDRKAPTVFNLKNYIHSFTPEEWVFGSFDDTVEYDITDDITGDAHEVAKKFIPKYVNETIDSYPTIHAEYDPERVVHYLFGIAYEGDYDAFQSALTDLNERLIDGNEVEVFVNYGPNYEKVRRRKGYSPATGDSASTLDEDIKKDETEYLDDVEKYEEKDVDDSLAYFVNVFFSGSATLALSSLQLKAKRRLLLVLEKLKARADMLANEHSQDEDSLSTGQAEDEKQQDRLQMQKASASAQMCITELREALETHNKESDSAASASMLDSTPGNKCSASANNMQIDTPTCPAPEHLSRDSPALFPSPVQPNSSNNEAAKVSGSSMGESMESNRLSHIENEKSPLEPSNENMCATNTSYSNFQSEDPRVGAQFSSEQLPPKLHNIQGVQEEEQSFFDSNGSIYHTASSNEPAYKRNSLAGTFNDETFPMIDETVLNHHPELNASQMDTSGLVEPETSGLEHWYD